MTINQLYKLLGQEIEKGHGRKKVLVHKEAFAHPLDGLSYHDITEATLTTHTVLGDDGFIKVQKDGTECLRTSLILRGDNHRF